MALNRPSVELDHVDASVIIHPLQLHHSYVTFINNDDDDDETLMQYYSDEEELLSVDLDIGIDD